MTDWQARRLVWALLFVGMSCTSGLAYLNDSNTSGFFAALGCVVALCGALNRPNLDRQ